MNLSDKEDKMFSIFFARVNGMNEYILKFQRKYFTEILLNYMQKLQNYQNYKYQRTLSINSSSNHCFKFHFPLYFNRSFEIYCDRDFKEDLEERKKEIKVAEEEKLLEHRYWRVKLRRRPTVIGRRNPIARESDLRNAAFAGSRIWPVLQFQGRVAAFT